MRLVQVAREFVDLSVSAAGGGIKSMLLDADAMATVTVAYPKSKLMAKGVYLFEKLEDPKARQSLPFVSCLVLASPADANVAALKAELAAPRFGRYHVFFAGRLPGSAVKALAEADTREVVASIMELPMSYRPLSDHVFLKSGGTVAATLSSIVDALDVTPSVSTNNIISKKKSITFTNLCIIRSAMPKLPTPAGILPSSSATSFERRES